MSVHQGDICELIYLQSHGECEASALLFVHIGIIIQRNKE